MSSCLETFIKNIKLIFLLYLIEDIVIIFYYRKLLKKKVSAMHFYFHYKNNNSLRKCIIILINNNIYNKCIRINRLCDLFASKMLININIFIFLSYLTFLI